MTIEGASPLHQELAAAIEASDADVLNALLKRHWEEIAAQFDSWARVPASIREDQQAASHYVQSLLSIARVLEAAGQPSFLQRLIGTDETNPIIQWNRRLTHAQALGEAGEYDESTAQLKDLLGDIEGTTGSAVANLLPKILGTIGSNAMHANDYAMALDYTRRAYDASVKAEDDQGRDAYYENLMSLRTIVFVREDSERGQRLLHVRRLIVHAQQSADAGRYLASKQKLLEVLAYLDVEAGDELFRALWPKVHGLIGFNEQKLGNVPAAREQTALALEKSKCVNDADGVRIYTASLVALGV